MCAIESYTPSASDLSRYGNHMQKKRWNYMNK